MELNGETTVPLILMLPPMPEPIILDSSGIHMFFFLSATELRLLKNPYDIGNPFNHLHYKVVKGATGLFHRQEFAKWAEVAGASNVEFTTPITVYKITK